MRVPDPLQQSLDLDLFEGPFDLLLTLVLREEIDLFELPLAELVPAALGEWADQRWDAATTGELVVVLAAMAELKARRLLGEPVEEEPDPEALEARERLAARLIEYAPYVRAARWLAERAEAARGPRYRRAPLTRPEPERVREDPRRLRDALAPVLRAPPAPSLAHLSPRRVNLSQVLTRLRAALSMGRAVSFDALVADRDPLDEAVTLMAALELAHQGEARLVQEVPFGDITMTGSRP